MAFTLARWLGVFLILVGAARVRADVSIYSDAVGNGFQDWSWGGISNDFGATAQKHSGSAAIKVTYTGGWSGLQLGNAGGVDATTSDILRFYIHGGNAGGQSIEVRCGNNSSYVSQSVTPTAGVWTKVDVPLADLGSPRQVTYVYWFNNTAGSQPFFYLDDVDLLNSGLPTPTPIPPGAGPALWVDADLDRRAIDPGIYGMNFADEDLALDLDLPVRRWGGNATTRYNWQNDTSNRAFDWYFENIPNDNPHPELLPDGSSSDQFIEQDQRTGTQTLLTVPLIGWTPKTRDYACGFSVAKYGAQQSVDSWRPDCGNGVRTNGNEISGNSPLDTSIAIDPSFVQGWMSHLIGRYGAAGSGGVTYYALDNEPMLWPDTHRDVHPQPTSYDEMRDRTWAYASAMKSTDSNAKIFGPAVWGWTAYFWSALDWSAGGSWWNNPQDRLAHGNVPFLEWYLQQMRSYEQSHGVRILDYLDIHYYPQASGVSLAPAGNSATQALRLRSTRSLWDPTYADESWIGDAVQLIPRMRSWIDTDYPGTKLAITEYNWGALDHINGAVAQADVLGIFGREGVDVATLWGPPTYSQPGAYAFRMYRNYDGNGGRFGETHVRAHSDDSAQLSVFAAQREGDSAMTILVVNKTALTLNSTLQIAGFSPAASAELYRYSSANLSSVVREADVDVVTSSIDGSFPPSSISLFVLPAANAGPSRTPTMTPSRTPTVPTATPTPTPSITETPIPAGCPLSPMTTCVTAPRASLKLKRPSDPARSALAWKWTRATVATGEFGDPTAGSSYALCVYDDSSRILALDVAAAGICGTRPCWKARGTRGFMYKNMAGNSSGVSSVKLASGSGSASIVVGASGSALGLWLPLAQLDSIKVQWIQDASSGLRCWESNFSPPATINQSDRFSDSIR